MRPAAFITGIVGMAMVVGLLLAGEARLSGGQGPAPASNAGDASAELPDPNADTTKPPASLTDEDAALIASVTEPQAAEPQAAPSPPASENATADEAAQTAPAPTEIPPTAPDGKESVQLLRPTVENAGLLSFGNRRLQIAGITATPVAKTCGSKGQQWPCGMMAKTALRLFLRNRTIDCDLPSDTWKDMASAACRLGQQDIGTWLVENGWVDTPAGSPLSAAGEKAKQAKQGIHGEDPRRRPAAAGQPGPADPL